MREALPPPFGAWVRRLVPDARAREMVEGDLAELHALRRREIGHAAACIRLFRDCLSLARARGAIGRISGRRSGPHLSRHEDPMNPVNDLRLAARTLLRSPAYSIVVVLTLALAIGATSAIFSVVDGVLLSPLPFEAPEDLYLVREIGPGDQGGEGPVASQSLFLAWREGGRAIETAAMYSNQSTTLTGLPEPARVTGIAASPALFPLLRAEAALGRTFAADEEMPGNDGVVVLSHRAWQRYFGGDPALLGSSIRMDDDVRTLVGVMPSGFRFPDIETDYWVPLLATPPETADEDAMASAARQQGQVRRTVTAEGGPGRPDGPGGGPGGPGGPGGGPDRGELHSIEMWGRLLVRLAPGATLAQADDEADRLVDGLRAGPRLPGAGEPDVELRSLLDQLVGPVRQPLLLLMGAVGFVLLIACANVVNLVMARSIGRYRETAVRASLGAGWMRLARFLFTESLLLAVVGALLGLALAQGGLRALSAAGPDFIPRLEDVAIDLRVLAFTALVTIVTALLTSLVPIRQAARLDLSRALKDETSHGRAGLGGGATRHLLVTVETAAAVVMLVGAGLLVSSFLTLTSVDHGYHPDNLLNVQLQLPAAAYPDAPSHLDTYDSLVDRLEALPAVDEATIANRVPSQPANIRVAIQSRTDEGAPASDAEPQPVGVRMVENNYFEAVGARLLEGRFFDRDDRPETGPVMVLSESAARALFGEGRVVGERIDFIGGQVEVVGVVADARTAGVDPTPQPDVFLPYRQAQAGMVPMLFRVATLLVRTDGDSRGAVAPIRDVLLQRAPDAVILSAVPLRDTLSDAVAEPRFYASLVSAFALLALLLAAIGIYGLLAYSVQQGLRDTAIRRALGAPADRILKGVLRRGLLLAGSGLAIGIVLSLALGRFLESMLYGVTPTSPVTLATVVALFAVVALAAVWVPARRATRVDPMDLLRREA